MRIWLVSLGLMLAVLLLGGCEGYADPQRQLEDAQVKIRATQRAQVEAEKARVEEARRATEEALATQGARQAEIDLVNAQAQGTLTALDVAQRELEGAVLASQATAAAEAYAAQAMEEAQVRQATATAMGIEMENARREAERKAAVGQWMDWVRMTGLVLLLGGLLAGLIIVVIFLWKWLDWKIAWTDRKKLVFDTVDGAIFLDYTTGDPRPVLIREISFYRPRSRPRLTDGRSDVDGVDKVDWINPDKPISQPVKVDRLDPTECALQVVEASIEHFGSGEAMSIPRWSVLMLSADVWKVGVDKLKELNLADNDPRKKTITYAKLGVVLYRLQHSPTP